MTKIKIFESSSIIDLEGDINRWLSSQQDDTNNLLKFVLVDIKITSKRKNYLDSIPVVVAVIIYKKQ